MREETDQIRDPSSDPPAEFYDSSIVDTIDLQSLSLNYPPIKPKRREDIPNYSSSSCSSNTQVSLPHHLDIKMFPNWVLDGPQRGRSPEDHFFDGSFPPPGRHRVDDDLPSYSDLYQLDNPVQSPSARDQNHSSPTSGYPLVGGLDFRGWERNDPEGDACFAAVSSTSRESDGMEGDRECYGQEAMRQEPRDGDRSSERSGESDLLVDLDDVNPSLPYPPTHRPDYPGLPSFAPLIPSRPPTSYRNPEELNQAEYEPESDESSLPMVSYDPDGTLSLNSNGATSKRKYDDEDEYHTQGNATAGTDWKRLRTRLPSSPPEDEYDISPTNTYNRDGQPTVPDLMDDGEEWQGDSLTMETSDNGEAPSDSFPDRGIQLVNNYPEQHPIESFTYRNRRFDSHREEIDQRDVTYNHEQQREDPISQSERPSDESYPEHAAEGTHWPSDGLTVVDPSADWQGHIPTHQSHQHSDDPIYREQSISGDMLPSDESLNSAIESQIAVEDPFTAGLIVEPPSTISLESPAPPQQAVTQPESRKRPAEEIHETTPSPIRKKVRRPAAKVILAKALPKPDLTLTKSPIHSPPLSSPIRPKNTTLGMKPRKPWASAPNRPSGPAASTSKPHQIITGKGPIEFFASVAAGKKSNKTKQKPFKPPLAGGGITLKPRDPNQSATNINYGNSTPGFSTMPQSVAARLAILEKEARTLRQAVKYQNESEEDDRLQHLINQWRTAGRDVVEQIFDRIPKPTDNDEAMSIDRNSNPWKQGGRNNDLELTEEQEKWLRNCDKNEDGEPIDEEGNTLLQKPQDLGVLMDEVCKERTGEGAGYLPRYEHDSRGKSKQVQAESREWNMGTMMLKMSIDPALLGWDDDLEDWVDTDSL